MAATETTFTDSKKHYEVLDGLRGVAAVMVVAFHLLEAFTHGNHLIQIINHGYLAVDFFFVLSGFVIGYAYDDRWGQMTLTGFFRRRLIRLHPMIIMGMLIGAILFYFGGYPRLFPMIADVPWYKVVAVMLVGFTLLPLPAAFDIRGWGEIYPLNGPAWSLFYEYVANIAYALFLRKLATGVLMVLAMLAGGVLIHFAVTNHSGDLVGGWSLDPAQLRVGLTRLMYPFLAGLVLARVFRPGVVKNAFLWCSLLVIAALSFPRIGGAEHLWMNGLYDSLTVIIVFPLIVYLGAGGSVQGRRSLAVSRFLGNISYPIYIIHYPLIYVFTAWVEEYEVSVYAAWPVAVMVFVASILIAWASLKWYDLPVRKYLTQKWISQKKAQPTD